MIPTNSITYILALGHACEMMEHGVEPTSALKQAARDAGLPYGTQEMEQFVLWATLVLFGGSPP